MIRALPVSNRFLQTCALAREQAAEEKRTVVVRHLPGRDDLAAVAEELIVAVMASEEMSGRMYPGRILYRAVPR